MTPDEHLAGRLARQFLECAAAVVRRFPTGSSHYVYDVEAHDGRRVVVRISRQVEHVRGTLYWRQVLHPLGVPLARVLHSNLSSETPYLILERLPGSDL